MGLILLPHLLLLVQTVMSSAVQFHDNGVEE